MYANSLIGLPLNEIQVSRSLQDIICSSIPQNFYRRWYLLKETEMKHYSAERMCSLSLHQNIEYLPNDGVCGHNEVRFLGKSAIRFKQLRLGLHMNIFVRGSDPQPVWRTGAMSGIHSLFQMVC